MNVEVKFFATFRDIAGRPKIDTEAETVSEALADVTERFAGLEDAVFDDESENSLKSNVVLMVNGRNILHLNGLDTSLEDGDKLAIFPPVGGG